jgi:hypothetical protein
LTESFEKIIGHFFGHTVNQSGSDLRQFPSDLRLGFVRKFGAIGRLSQTHDRRALAKSHSTTLALKMHHA